MGKPPFFAKGRAGRLVPETLLVFLASKPARHTLFPQSSLGCSLVIVAHLCFGNVSGTFLGRLWTMEKRSCNDGVAFLCDDNPRMTLG